MPGLYLDSNSYLWVLDLASPQMHSVVSGGAKLLTFDPATKQPAQGSYLNNGRADATQNFAYVSESGQGSLLVVNLNSGRPRRLLGGSPATKSRNLMLTVENRVWRNASGQLSSVNVDGIVLAPARDYLYFHATTARTPYRTGTQYLQDESLTDSQVSSHVERRDDTNPTDGMAFYPSGNLYLTDITQNAITHLKPDNRT